MAWDPWQADRERGFDVLDVILPSSPAPRQETFVAWWLRESTETREALHRYVGWRAGSHLATPYREARGRGNRQRWSSSYLDGLFPDGTRAYPVGSVRADRTRSLVVDPLGMTPKRTSKYGPKQMTDDHKKAISEGRKQNKAIGDYLERLGRTQKRGRRRTPESITARLAVIEENLPTAARDKILVLLQEQEDLTAELAALEEGGMTEQIEEEFVTYAKPYAVRLGITYATFRKAGVPADILKRAGITQG